MDGINNCRWNPCLHSNIIGDELLLNFGAKFQRYFVISRVKLQNCHGNPSVQLSVKMATKLKCREWRCQGTKRRFRKPEHGKEHIKKDSNRYFAEKFWKILNFISQI